MQTPTMKHTTASRHGRGTYYCTNGNKYTGDWADGEMTGQGVYVWGPETKWSGDKYE
ncbi:unnamed protein product, partial [Rotaria sp. Silwood1]